MPFLDTPDQLFGDLFRQVQLRRIFLDNKTFADATPKSSALEILAAYDVEKNQTNFDLETFVLAHFNLPKPIASGFESTHTDSVSTHIQKLWPILTRQPETVAEGSSLLPLPHPYIVPGGRFGEIYYWDSYFTMLGLIEKQPEIVAQMVDNFAYLIDTYGHVPNGNRTYFLSRSQPPFFALMVHLLADAQGKAVYLKYLPALQKEHHFWMNGTEKLTAESPAYRRVVRMPNGMVLNRYWDDRADPRPESYFEDIALAHNSTVAPQILFRHLRAACESGWDFSARWFADITNFSSIRTTDLLPVDLNCLLFQLENTLAVAHDLAGNKTACAHFKKQAKLRSEALENFFWDESTGTFQDVDWVKSGQTGVVSLATVYPLFARLASKHQAQRVAAVLQRDFLKQGGLITTLVTSGQQWDSPNGWPCLQWLAIAGLRQYAHHGLAKDIKNRWLTLNEATFERTGKMLEKYNVMQPKLPPMGGEYTVQDGFGWTNGVYVALQTNLPLEQLQAPNDISGQ